MAPPLVLETRGLTRRFGSLAAVDGVSLRVPLGQLRAIIGPNGAGKTTFFNLLSGLLAPDQGEILFKGRVITRLSPARRAGLGVSRIFQIPSIFPKLTVLENVRVAAQARSRGSFRLFARADGRRELIEKAHATLASVGLGGKERLPADALSHGDKRLLEMAIALAADPELLLLDEPTAGLSEGETEKVVRLVRSLAGRLTIVLIEHDMDVILTVADRITVMHFGKVLAEGNPGEIQANEEVQSVYLGGVR